METLNLKNWILQNTLERLDNSELSIGQCLVRGFAFLNYKVWKSIILYIILLLYYYIYKETIRRFSSLIFQFNQSDLLIDKQNFFRIRKDLRNLNWQSSVNSFGRTLNFRF